MGSDFKTWGGKEGVPGVCAPSHFGKEKNQHNTLIRGDRGDSVCVLTLSSLPPHLPLRPPFVVSVGKLGN